MSEENKDTKKYTYRFWFVSVMLQDMSMDMTGSFLLESHFMSSYSTKAHFDFRGTKAATRC